MKNPYFDLIRAVWHYGKPYRFTTVILYITYVFFETLGCLASKARNCAFFTQNGH